MKSSCDSWNLTSGVQSSVLECNMAGEVLGFELGHDRILGSRKNLSKCICGEV